MASLTPATPATLRRMQAMRKLENQIPRVNATSIIIRVAQFLVLGAFSLAYAMSRPEVYLDIFVWPQNTPPPYMMKVFRNTTRFWYPRAEHLQNQWDAPAYDAMEFQWNETHPPPGLSEKYACEVDPRWGCNGEQWAATRVGWLDSWPFQHATPVWVTGTVHIDRYIFWLIMIGGYLGIGHNITVLVHAIEPSGTGFYRYSAIMDFVISIIFLLLGIFPLAIQRHLETLNENSPSAKNTLALAGIYTDQLKPNQRYAFCMGWILWSLYTVTFLLNTILVSNLERFMNLPRQIQSSQLDEFLMDTPVGISTGYQVRNQEDDPEATGSYSRSTGREREVAE